ncbi:hypothetical protein ACIOJD_17610 [Streptomyces sp. NPDC088116]|uniref:hypothetical protein n=1 Tax=Streptomyces sp. NPDC088116 TaxID=3365825 RepID=UPI00382C183C
MAEVPSEEAIFKAVAQHIGLPGEGSHLVSQALPVERSQVIDFRIDRSIEARTEIERSEPGSVDLSGRAAYDTIEDHHFEPPKDPTTPQRLTMVLRDSVREVVCVCEDGKTQCPRCTGSGRYDCPPTVVCEGCLGVEACTACAESANRKRGGGRPTSAQRASAQRTAGQRASGQGTSTQRASAQRASGGQAAGRRTSGQPEERVTCTTCGRPDAACPACRGRGVVPCPDCKGKGTVNCARCKASGVVEHPACGGKGRRTSWREGTIRHTPGSDEVSLPAKRPPYQVRRRMARVGDWKRTVLTGFHPLPDDVAPEHRAEIERRLVRRAREVARRVTIRHLNVVRVELVTEPNRVFYVFPGRERTEVVQLPSRRKVSRVATIATGLALVLLLVLVLSH